MLNLKGKYTSTELIVEIHTKDVLDIEIVDLPGYPQDTEPNYQDVVDIINQVLQNENAHIIAIANGSNKDMQNQPIYTSLDKVMGNQRPNWRKDDNHIMIFNYVNNALKNMFDVANFNEYFKKAVSTDNHFFVMLVPDDGVNIDKMTTTDKEKYILNSRDNNEINIYNQFVTKVTKADPKGGIIDPLIVKNVGVNNAVRKLQEMQSKQFMKNLPNNVNSLEKVIESNKNEIKNIDSLVQLNQPEVIKNKYFDYLEWFEKVYDALLDGKWFVSPIDNAGLYGANDVLDFRPIDHGYVFNDEISKLNLPLPPFDMKLLDLLPDTNNGLKTLLGYKLTGKAAIQRLFKVFSFVVYSLKMYQATTEELTNACSIQHTYGAIGQVDGTKCVSYINMKSVRELKHFTPWFYRHFESIIMNHFNSAEDYLTNQTFSAISGHGGFFIELKKLFENSVQPILSTLSNDTNIYFDNFADSIQLDAVAGLLIINTLIPFQDDICPMNHMNINVNPSTSNGLTALVDTDLSLQNTTNSPDVTVLCQAITELITANNQIRSQSITHVGQLVDAGIVTIPNKISGSFKADEYLAISQKYLLYSKFFILNNFQMTINTQLSLKKSYLHDFLDRAGTYIQSLQTSDIQQMMNSDVSVPDLKLRKDQILDDITSYKSLLRTLKSIKP